MTQSALGPGAFLHALANAISARSLYPAAHPRVAEAVDALLLRVEEMTSGKEELTLLVVGEDLVVEGKAVRGQMLYHDTLLRALRRRDLERLTLEHGLEGPDLLRLLNGLCGEEPLGTGDGVTVGRIQLAFSATPERAAGGGPGEGSGGSGEGPFTEVQMGQAVDALRSFSSRGGEDLSRLESTVWHLMEATARSTSNLLLLAPLRDRGEHDFQHAVQVCLLTLAHARALGFGGTALHELGIAALVHDIGKLDQSEVGMLDPLAVDRHPELGAARLCALRGVPSVAISVAFEHHLRFDGRRSRPVTTARPGLPAQLVAISNAWDHALQRWSPASSEELKYRAARTLRDEAGSSLDPILVGSFIRVVAPGTATAAAGS